jgi:hypothetical protein
MENFLLILCEQACSTFVFLRQGMNFFLLRLFALRWKKRVQSSPSLSQIIRKAWRRRARSTATTPRTLFLISLRIIMSSWDSSRWSCTKFKRCIISLAMWSSILAFPKSFLLHCLSLTTVRWNLKNRMFRDDTPGTDSFHAPMTTSLKPGTCG